jgi:hypothetical protein
VPGLLAVELQHINLTVTRHGERLAIGPPRQAGGRAGLAALTGNVCSS